MAYVYAQLCICVTILVWFNISDQFQILLSYTLLL